MTVILSVLLAQTGPAPSIDVWSQITGLTIAGFATWLFRDERTERRAAQAQSRAAQAETLELAKSLLPLIEEATSTLERVQAGMERQVEKARTPASDDVNAVLAELKAAARDLSERLPQRRRGNT